MDEGSGKRACRGLHPFDDLRGMTKKGGSPDSEYLSENCGSTECGAIRDFLGCMSKDPASVLAGDFIHLTT